MMIGRSRPFLRYLKPLLEKHFSVTGPEWEIENLYRHLITLRRGLIRVDADELTYPLHIMLRYELEQRILAGELAVKDLPEAWNAWMDAKLGVRPSNDAEGCLQDIHWAVGSFGYFPSYAVGAMIAGQLYEALLAEVPGIDAEVAGGKFGSVFEWLRKNVHSLGAKLSVEDLIKNATGKPLTAAAFLRYAEAKYLEPIS
jgi:carboxypeptidase Taq